MFVAMTAGLKSMGRIRIGYGLRVTKRNAPYMLMFVMFVLMFRLMWYIIIGAGWGLYGLLWLYYQLFRGIWIGAKKLFLWGKKAVENIRERRTHVE